VTGKGCIMTAIAAALAACIVVFALLVGLRLRLNAQAEQKIMNALTNHYRGRSLTIEDREEFSTGWDYQFHYQVCFALLLDGREHRIAMVLGDSDGGSFEFGREYASMRDCEAHFNRG
jgi:hypothetical protein